MYDRCINGMRIHRISYAVEFASGYGRTKDRMRFFCQYIGHHSSVIRFKLSFGSVRLFSGNLIIVCKLNKHKIALSQPAHHLIPQTLFDKCPCTSSVLCMIFNHYILIEKRRENHSPTSFGSVCNWFFIGHC